MFSCCEVVEMFQWLLFRVLMIWVCLLCFGLVVLVWLLFLIVMCDVGWCSGSICVSVVGWNCISFFGRLCRVMWLLFMMVQLQWIIVCSWCRLFGQGQVSRCCRVVGFSMFLLVGWLSLLVIICIISVGWLLWLCRVGRCSMLLVMW